MSEHINVFITHVEYPSTSPFIILTLSVPTSAGIIPTTFIFPFYLFISYIYSEKFTYIYIYIYIAINTYILLFYIISYSIILYDLIYCFGRHRRRLSVVRLVVVRLFVRASFRPSRCRRRRRRPPSQFSSLWKERHPTPSGQDVWSGG